MFEDFKAKFNEGIEAEAAKYNKTKGEYLKDVKDAFIFMGKCVGSGIIIGICATTGFNKKRLDHLRKKYPVVIPCTKWEEGIDKFHLNFKRFNDHKKKWGGDELIITTTAENAIESFEGMLKEARALKATLKNE